MKRLIRNKLFKRIIISLVVLILLSQLTTACLQFRMTPQQVMEYYQADKRPILNSIDVNGRKIHFAYQNNNKDVTAVFIHGAPGSWSAFADFLKDDSLRKVANIIAVDRPGYGYSNFGDPMVSLEEQAFMISKALQQFPKQRFILIGHSLGGPVAARMAMDYPELVSGMVLVAPSIDPDQEKGEWYRYLGKNKLAQWFLPKTLFVTNEEIFDLKEELITMLPYWHEIRVPVIVIQGTEDKLVPKENADFAKRMINPKYLDLWLLEGVNHFIPWNNSGKITKAIVDEAEEVLTASLDE